MLEWNERDISCSASLRRGEALRDATGRSITRGVVSQTKYNHHPSEFPIKLMTGTFSLISTGSGECTPAACSLRRFRISFSAHSLTIFRGSLE